MRRSTKFGWAAVTLAIIFARAMPIAFGAPGSALTQGSKPSFALTISAAKAPLKTGSTVQIDVVVKNISGHDISLETYYTRPYVETTDQVSIVDEDGVKPPETQFGRAALGHSPGSSVTGKGVFMKLKTGQSFTYELKTSELYDLSHPGKCRIQIERFDPDSKTVVKSNTITVTVTP